MRIKRILLIVITFLINCILFGQSAQTLKQLPVMMSPALQVIGGQVPKRQLVLFDIGICVLINNSKKIK